MRSHRFVAATLMSIASVATPGWANAQSYTFKVLASFDGGNGKNPTGGLIVDGQGNLFGTTLLGGSDGEGTIFELPAGTSTPVTLASFSGVDGAFPTGALVADSRGNFFGTTQQGGTSRSGNVFELPAGSHTP